MCPITQSSPTTVGWIDVVCSTLQSWMLDPASDVNLAVVTAKHGVRPDR